jgi:hypothetical protein
MRAVWQTPPSAPKDRHEQAERDADDEAGDDRKIESAVFAFDADVAGQTTKPPWSEAAPENRAEDKHNRADDHQKFP